MVLYGNMVHTHVTVDETSKSGGENMMLLSSPLLDHEKFCSFHHLDIFSSPLSVPS